MDALDCIKTRRSVRRFTAEPVTPAQVREVVEAAAFAPSWKNTQVARYILVEDRAKIETIGTDAVLVHTQLPSAAPSKPGLWQSLRARLGL